MCYSPRTPGLWGALVVGGTGAEVNTYAKPWSETSRSAGFAPRGFGFLRGRPRPQPWMGVTGRPRPRWPLRGSLAERRGARGDARGGYDLQPQGEAWGAHGGRYARPGELHR